MVSTVIALLTRMTRAIALITLACLSACQPVPWGEGAVELPATLARTVGGIERHLTPSALVDAAAALTTATVGTAMRFIGPGSQSGFFFERELAITSFDLKIDRRGLALVANIPQADLVWWQNPSDDNDMNPGCGGRIALGPGTFSVALDFATDKLGRITTLAAERADWDGPFDYVPAPSNGSECKELDDFALANLLSRRVPATIAEHEAGQIARALGFALAAPLDNLSALTRAPLRTHLRARNEQPVVVQDGGLSAYFELQIQAETAPCLAPWSFTPGLTTNPSHRPSAPDDLRATGLFVPRTAIASSLESFAIAGGLCGGLTSLSAPLKGSVVAELVPSWAKEIARGRVDDFTLAWQPHGPPTVVLDAEGRLRWQIARVDADIYGAWGGASWRLASLETAIDLDISLEVQRNGAIVAFVQDVKFTGLVVHHGLLRAPPGGELDALILFAIGAALDGREFVRLPAELAPVESAEVLVDPSADGLFIPTR